MDKFIRQEEKTLSDTKLVQGQYQIVGGKNYKYLYYDELEVIEVFANVNLKEKISIIDQNLVRENVDFDE